MHRLSLLRALVVVVAGLGGLSAAAPSVSAQGQCIAAMVNDLPITAFDLSQRVRFALLASRVADTADNRDRIGQQVLRNMIDERLQLADAKRNGINVSRGEIDERLRQVEQANGMPPGGFEQVLRGAGISINVLRSQIEANLAWSKLLLRKVRGTIGVTDPEVDEALRQIKSNAGKSENRVAEIFIAVDRPDQADEGLRTARRIVEQLRAGAPFAAMVQQFSSGSSAAAGGDLGWVLPGTLDPAVDAAIARLGVNQVSDPVRTQAGWHIVKLLAQRSIGQPGNPAGIRLNMVQLLLPLPNNSSPEEVERQKGVAQGLMSRSKSCADLRRVCNGTKGCTSADSESVPLAALPPAIAEAARTAGVGQALGPYQAGNAIQIVAVCSREGDGGLPSRDAIERSIQSSKLEAAARRYMRDIRRNAVVDIRKNCRI